MSDSPASLPSYTEASDVSSSFLRAFGNPMITDRILLHLSISDISQCSLVSEFWRRLCRRYLRCRMRLEINLEFDADSVAKLDLMVMNMNSDLCPFVGSMLLFKHPPSSDCHVQGIDTLMSYPYIFQKLPVKIFRIDMKFYKSFDCVCDNFLKKLLITRVHKFTEYLELIKWPACSNSLWKYLSIPHHSENPAALQRSNLFQSLRSCKFRCFGDNFPGNIIFEIINSSPNLERIYGRIPFLMFASLPYSFGVQLPLTKLQIIKEVVVETTETMNALLQIKPKLELFGFGNCILWGKDTKRTDAVKRSLSKVIYNSSSSLVTLVANNSTHLLYHVINIPLINCVVLKLTISPTYMTLKEIVLFLKAVNFEIYCPNLRCVDLAFSRRNYVTKYDINNMSSLYKCAKFTSFSVNTIKIKCKGVDFQEEIHPWSVMSDVFPNVKSLHLYEFEPSASPEIVRNLGMPWNQTLEVICFYCTDLEKPLLVILTELLENLLDVSLEEFLTIDSSNFNEWSYAPTRDALFKRRAASSRFVVVLQYKFRCCIRHGTLEPDIRRLYTARFEKISLWIRTKLPEFTLVLKFNPCEEPCNPIPFHTGRIQTNFKEVGRSDHLELGSVSKNSWVLSF